MKEFKIFIASSNDEKEERYIIKDLLQTVNRVTHNFGIEFTPIMWELESVVFKDGLDKKQNEYNDLLISSDIVFFIFGRRVGKFTYEEFLTACEQVAKNKNLKVFVYFKNIDIGRISTTSENDIKSLTEIKELQQRIGKNLNQVYGEYEKNYELQNKIIADILNVVIPSLMKKESYDSNIENLIHLYMDIDKPFQISKRDNIICDAINSLFFLYKYNLSPDELNNQNFYDLLHVVISGTFAGSSINALSIMLRGEWDNSENEKIFWDDNQAAVKRNVNLERIFIVNKNAAHRLKTNLQIKNHIALENRYPNIHSYIVEKEVLQLENPMLLELVGNGFIMIDSTRDKMVLLDETPESDCDKRATPIFDDQKIAEITSTFNEVKKIAQPLKKYLNNIAWSHCKKEMISIFVTTKCNLNCDYCFTNKNQSEHKNQTIDLEFVKKGIDDYFAQNYMRHVRFFGAGEPTVEFDLLKVIHDYAIKKGGEAVTFEIQTNGAFSDSVAIWLKKNIQIIWISCDGTPEIQDSHRPFKNDERKTSQVIEKNIRLLHGVDSISFVGIRSTITEENINKQKEMIDYFYGLGIKNIWVDPIFPSVGKTVSTVDNKLDMMLFAKEFLEATKYANSKGVFYGSILTCNFNDTVNKHCRACLPVPHLTTDGFVSACDMALFGKDKNHMSDLIYGEWDEKTKTINYNNSKMEKLRSRTTENMQHCEMCSAKEHCGGYCLGEVLNETGDLFGYKAGVCQAICYLDKHLDSKIREYKYTHP